MTSALKVKQWCDKTLSPLAWTRISMRLLPVFSKEKINLIRLDESVMLTDEQLRLIMNTILDVYKIEMEEFLKSNINSDN